MFVCVDYLLEKYSIDKIYLVTEEQSYLDAFCNRYKGKVIYSEYYRTYDKNGYTIKPPRENHIYLLGKEITVCAFLLSKCEGLLHSSSNVSEFARFENHDKYKFRCEIKNGTNTNRRIMAKYLYFIKKMLPSKLGGLLGDVVVERNHNGEKSIEHFTISQKKLLEAKSR